MHLPASLVMSSFRAPPPGVLDLDAAGSPRHLQPLPVETGAAGARALRAGLAWFWNSNADEAEAQIRVLDRYRDAVGGLIPGLALRAGDRVVLSGSLPDARRAAWLAGLPEGVTVANWLPEPDGRLGLGRLDDLVDDRVRMVLLSKSCPVTGALNEIVPVWRRLLGSGARLVVEASHFLAHGPLDIRNFRCDAVITGVDELFGASGAALWMRRPLGAPPLAENAGPLPARSRALARAVAYVERLGNAPGAPPAPPSDRFGRRAAMRIGMQRIRQYERVQNRRVLEALAGIRSLRILGESLPRRAALRAPFFAIGTNGTSAATVWKRLRGAGIEVAAGDLGCSRVLTALGADPGRGALRATLAHYHDARDVARFGEALAAAVTSG